MLRVGLTGGISTGKSTVGQMFVACGCRLIDADIIVHRFFDPGQEVNQAVAAEFGPSVVATDGSINRKVLGEIVFNDAQARGRLNAIVHPAVIRAQDEWLDQLARTEPDAIGIVEAALMIEAGSHTRFDALIVVVCSPQEQRRRLKERSGLSDEQIEARISAQMSMEEKASRADFIVDNSFSLDNTRSQVRDIYNSLRSRLA